MIIVYSNVFESVLHAVLLSNLTGFPLLPKVVVGQRFDTDDHIDVDSLNWNQIYEDHSLKYGPVIWLENRQSPYTQFKEHVQSLIRENTLSEYITSVERIKQALKFGLVEA